MLSVSPMHRVVILACALAIAACGTGDEREPVENLDAFDPYSYFELWNGDLTLPDYPTEHISEDQWDNLVDQALRSGLLSLSDEERHRLFRGAIKAYLLSVESTVRFLETETGASSEIVERYRQVDGYYVELAAREDRSANLETDWPDLAFSSPSPVHARLFKTSSSIERWTTSGDGAWQCEQRAREGSSDFTGLEYYWNTVETMLQGEPLGEEAFYGRDSVFVEWDWGDSATRGIWVDAATFFPLGFRLPADRSVPSRLVRITAINVDTVIDRPAETCSIGGKAPN